jgi:hypothetical protein
MIHTSDSEETAEAKDSYALDKEMAIRQLRINHVCKVFRAHGWFTKSLNPEISDLIATHVMFKF